MKPITLFTLLSLLLAACTAATSVPTAAPTLPPTEPPTTVPTLAPELQAYLDEALDLIEAHSLYVSGSNMDDIRLMAYQAAAGAQSIPDLYPVISLAIQATGDRHGYVWPPSDVEAYFDETVEQVQDPIKSELKRDRIGYLYVPSFVSGNPEAASAYATQLQDAIEALDVQHPCGWIVDLRNNDGGNGFAMLLGVSPLLGDGMVAAYTEKNGQARDLVIQGNQLYLGDILAFEIDRPVYRISQPGAPIAVMTSQNTTSGGELIAIAFRGWPNTRSFGQRTLGRTTAPDTFFLSDGAILGISTSYFTDHTSVIYKGQVKPDESSSVQHAGFSWDESTLDPAYEWLFSQSACAGQ